MAGAAEGGEAPGGSSRTAKLPIAGEAQIAGKAQIAGRAADGLLLGVITRLATIMTLLRAVIQLPRVRVAQHPPDEMRKAKGRA